MSDRFVNTGREEWRDWEDAYCPYYSTSRKYKRSCKKSMARYARRKLKHSLYYEQINEVGDIKMEDLKVVKLIKVYNDGTQEEADKSALIEFTSPTEEGSIGGITQTFVNMSNTDISYMLYALHMFLLDVIDCRFDNMDISYEEGDS